MERERKKVGDRIQASVVPLRVADGKIDAAIAVIPKKAVVLSLAGTRIEDPRAGGQVGRERGYCAFDRAFEVEHVVAHEAWQQTRECAVSHYFLRASTITVEPARQAASRTAKGKQASTRQK